MTEGKGDLMTLDLVQRETPEVSPRSGFFPVPTASLCVDTIADFDLYIMSHPGESPVLYRARDLPFDEEDRRRLEAGAVRTLYVQSAQEREFRRYVENNLKVILADNRIPLPERTEVLYGSAMQVVKDILDDPRAGEVLPRSRRMVENAVEFMFHEPTALQNMLKVTSYDYYTFTHSVNVFVFSLSLARRMGYTEGEVLQFGCGTLLHDIGKCMIDPEIVNFPGKLTPEMFAEVKLHPVHGYTLLKSQGMRDGIDLDIVRHHHEKLTGKGYPDGLQGSDISPVVRISTAADIFDALTTRRSYREALKSFDALALMKAEMSRDLDGEVFRCLVGMMRKPGQE